MAGDPCFPVGIIGGGNRLASGNADAGIDAANSWPCYRYNGFTVFSSFASQSRVERASLRPVQTAESRVSNAIRDRVRRVFDNGGAKKMRNSPVIECPMPFALSFLSVCDIRISALPDSLR